MNAIHQEVTVQEDGVLRIHAAELRHGDIAEVTVRLKKVLVGIDAIACEVEADVSQRGLGKVTIIGTNYPRWVTRPAL